MSSLKIGLVTSSNEESDLLVKLLENSGAQILHNISAQDISAGHIEDDQINVWLLNIDDDSWHDSVDQLLDESEIPVYFSEPGTLSKQAHPEYWCANLLDRLYEITGLEKKPEVVARPAVSSHNSPEKPSVFTETITPDVSEDISEQSMPLSNALDELELSTAGLPSDIAAELVNELESIPPVLQQAPDEIEKDKSPAASEHLVPEQQSAQSAIESLSEAEEHVDIEQDVDLDSLEDFQIEEFDFSEEAPNSTATIERTEPADEESVNAELSHDLDFMAEEDSLKTSDIEMADFNEELNDVAFENTLLEDEQAESSDIELMELDDNELADEGIDQLFLEPLELSVEDTESNQANGAEFEEQVELEFEDDVEQSEGLELTLQIDDSHQKKTAPVGKATYQIDKSDKLPEEVIVQHPDNDEQDEAPEQELGLQLEPLEHEASTDSKESFLDEIAAESESTESTEIEFEQLPDFKQSAKAENEIEELSLDNSAIDSIMLEDSELGANAFEDLEQDSDEIELQPIKDESELVLESMVGQSSESEWLVNDQPLEDNKPLLSNELQGQDEDATIDDLAEEEDLDFSLESIKEQAQTVEHLIRDTDKLPPDETDMSMALAADVSLNEEDKAALLAELSEEDFDDEEVALNGTTSIESELNGVRSRDDSESENKESALEFEIPMLEETASDINFEEKPQPPNKVLTPCWVIGASLGGPAAVKRFMQSLPQDIQCSFVIAQHIDENFLPVLAEILTNNSQFAVTVANGSNEMSPGTVLIAPLKGKIVFLKDGSMLIDHSQKWSGPYSPCINDVIEAVSHAYGELAGAIVFSGMGQDGLNGAIKMRQQGGQVWAQSTETCANASMPEAIISNGEADFVGSPEELAEKLVAIVNRHQYQNRNHG